ncbi:hypothetical protein G4B88_008483 [Cannabis sativa]|uniref:Reverse transcriptase zinc-binding domain-containing protein n=1 Tax=Cannabis sativa TaxID=3483 RepID=A0A7J6E9B3_CANSA|nr:hypothetical protein G4B88_008483 [Cannabis sativa]
MYQLEVALTSKYSITLVEFFPSGPEYIMRPPIFRRISYVEIEEPSLAMFHSTIFAMVFILSITFFLKLQSKTCYLIKRFEYVDTRLVNVSATFFTALMTIAADLASKPVVGSSIKIMDGFETSSTAIVSRLRCSFERPLTPGYPPIRISPSMYPMVFLPARTSSKVVFPAPLTPINAVRTPGLNEPLKYHENNRKLTLKETQSQYKPNIEKITFCHRGERNSFTERPISPYVKGETQKPHFNQTGIDANNIQLKKIYDSVQNEREKKKKLLSKQAMNLQLLTRDNLVKLHVDIDSLGCPVCTAEYESHEHLLFRCYLSRQVVEQIFNWLGKRAWPTGLVGWQSWLAQPPSNTMQVVDVAVFVATCYCLWLNKNKFSFEGYSKIAAHIDALYYDYFQ